MSLSPRDRALLACADATPPVWVVTPTRRLARALSLRVAELRAGAGRAVCETPPILAVDDWLGRLGREALRREVEKGGAAGRVLLSPHATRALWERVIADAPSDQPRELLDTWALAGTAAEAWARVCVWGEPAWGSPLAPLAQDAEAFRDWLPSFRARLAEGGLATEAELPAIVADAIRAGAFDESLPAQAVAACFEKVDPALDRFLGALRARGVAVRDGFGEEAAAPATPAVWTAATPAAEVRTVAARIRALLLADPGLEIAVLAPDLGAYGSRLERVFEEELDPAGVLDPAAGSVRRFDFAEAPSLSDYPLVAAALDILSLDAATLPFETASRILLSQYPREAGDGADRARVLRGRVEAALRSERSAVLRLGRPSRPARTEDLPDADRRREPDSMASRLASAGLAAFASGFDRLAERLVRDSGTRRAPGAWRREWRERLRMVGWPGPLEGDVEGQVFRRWLDALEEFVRLEDVEPSMDARHALSRLRAICSATPVQPPAASRSVQVMSLLDAAGLEFDVVFAIGMTATALPPAPRPNPLLPVLWQRAQAGMPRVSVEAEAALAAAVWGRVLGSAPVVHASWAKAGDSGEEQSPSAVLSGFKAEDAPRDGAEPWWLESARSSGDLEARGDAERLPPLVRSGGSSILAQQSDCPFRALAATRLGAERLAEIAPQPDAARRGTLVHEALAFVYGLVRTSDDLDGLDDDNIADLARRAAAHAVDKHAVFFADADDLAAVVKSWLADMVSGWLRHERAARSGPWEVAHLEKDYSVEYPPGAPDPLTIRFRPDRIDAVEAGGIVILDFKTSSTPKGPSRWNGPRPEEPQLPLYLLLLEQEGMRVDGIAFANLAARDACVLDGTAAREYAERLRPPGRRDRRTAADYEAKAGEWREAVDGLVAAYLAGDVRVDPRKADVCRRCSSQALCRVAEAGPPDEDDEDEEGGQ